MSDAVRLHGFFRSSASWRVRIALHMKGVAYEQITYRLRAGEQRSPAYLTVNPQGLVPALEIDGLLLTQSLAIIEYLDQTRPGSPLLPSGAAERARVRALALAIACDTHPVQNLKVLLAVQALGHDEAASNAWAHRVCEEGLAAYAAMVENSGGAFSAGDQPSLADLALVPQIANARRFGVDIRWPRLVAIERACMALPAFSETAPQHQPDFIA
ncbi:maleylacetoacetate isomerase [Novosphingobium sp. KN65.2]|uniref:maleylacetoacetate isomerase n=1 Tax=Novosphingobium sp. KN65.2 TaxID=1478134 RepID=UPI0005E967D1|nr:maleylacetoacetate isomerase [Novosphingobium sp. KN65.2]CDO36603.1 Maleylacetoacetate isomerase, MAAI (Glutathione S-transferase zeta 1, GSTZ1-1) [Novosphingobium sp. KN65.2]